MKSTINSFQFLTTFAIMVILSGCQSSISPSDEMLTQHQSEESIESPVPQESEGITKHTIVIEKMQFNPADLTIHKGDTIVWINKGIVDHDISEYPNKSWTSGVLKIGDSWESTPSQSFDYFCSIHMTMKGSIQVID